MLAINTFVFSIVKIDIGNIESERFPFFFFLKVNILFIIWIVRKVFGFFISSVFYLKKAKGKNVAAAVFPFWRE